MHVHIHLLFGKGFFLRFAPKKPFPSVQEYVHEYKNTNTSTPSLRERVFSPLRSEKTLSLRSGVRKTFKNLKKV